MHDDKPLSGKVVVISGASSGIGEATARLLASRGAKVVLGARRIDRLQALAKEIGANAFAAKLDVTQRAEFAAFIDQAKEKFGRVDAIVNNAGVMPLSPFAALKTDEWDRMIDVNIRGVLNGIAAGLPSMLQQGSGHFVNISSTAGHTVSAMSGVYSATKFAVRAISEGLRQENERIRVTVISPGAVKSELAETISIPPLKAAIDDYRKVALDADVVARAIAYALEQPPEVDVNEILLRPTLTTR